MANVAVATASQVQKWDAMFLAEYVRSSGFMPYMSRGSNSVICAKYELTSGGKSINIPLVTRLTGNGVTGSTQLEGSEEALGNYNQNIAIEWYRNAVAIPKDQQHYTEMDLRRASRDVLSNWAMEGLRDSVIASLASKGGVAYATSTQAQRDAWVDDNLDRVLFGDAKGNVATTAPAGGATNDHSASMAAVTASMTLGAAEVTLMKRIAKTADPHIRPMRVSNSQGREYFVLFCNSLQFRDLKNDTTIAAANREARERNVNTNPIFQDGDLIYDGVIVREIPELGVLAGAGGSSADIAECYLCGAQALGVAWGQEPRSTTETRDYGFIRGVGIEEARGTEKMVFNDKDHGMVTGYFASVADA